MNEINFNIEDIEKIDLSMDVGVKEIYPPIEDLEVTPKKEQQVFTHENSYGYDKVTVNAVSLQDKSITINENGTHSIVADDEYSGLNQVNVTVDAIEDLTEELTTYNTELTEQETTIEEIVEALKVKSDSGDKSLLTIDMFDKTNAGSPYRYIKLCEKGEVLKMIFKEKDPSVSISGCYFGFGATGGSASGGIAWSINAGDPISNAFPTTTNGDYEYINIYPSNKDYIETWNKLFARYDIYIAKGKAKLENLIDGTFYGSYYNDNVINVKPSAFEGCDSLTGINLPYASTVSNYGFKGCKKLVNVVLPLVTIVNYGSFNECASLVELDFPNCTYINNAAFSGCTKLNKLVLRANKVATLANTGAFNNTLIASGTGYIYVPDTLLTQYQQATNWSNYASQIKPISELED